MATKLSNIDIAYQFLKDKKEGADFNSVWNAVASEIHANANQKDRLIADLYAEMVLDNRFALTSDGKWATRSNMSASDIKKQYDNVGDFDYDADFDDFDDEEDDDSDDSDDDSDKSSDDEDEDTDKETDDEDDDDDNDDVSGEDSYDDGDNN